MNKTIIKLFIWGLMIFKILTASLSTTAYKGIFLHKFVLRDYNQVLCPNVHTEKKVH